MKPKDTEEDIKLHNDAVTVLCEFYPDYGTEYCIIKSAIDRKYLRAKVQYLKLKLTDKGRSYVNKTKHKAMKGKATRTSSSGGVRYPDKLSNLEKIALFGG